MSSEQSVSWTDRYDEMFKNGTEYKQIRLEGKYVLQPGVPKLTKAHGSDVGWDLLAFERVEDVFGDGKLEVWSTGISVCPPEGYYFQVVARSSLAKAGWSVANSPGIIDPSYRGLVKLLLRKDHPNAKPIQALTKVAQLLLCNVNYCTMTPNFSLSSTERGHGGFGSSGK